MIDIKKININDAEALHHLSRETFYETFKDDNSKEDMENFLDEAYNIPKLSRELSHPHSSFYFVYDEDELAGYIKLNVKDAQQEDLGEDALEIERLYLLPTHQGKGLGKQLMEFAIDKAKKAGKKKVWLGVWEHNTHAKSLYAKFGFEKFGEHVFQVGSDKQIDELLMKMI